MYFKYLSNSTDPFRKKFMTHGGSTVQQLRTTGLGYPYTYILEAFLHNILP